MMSMKKLVLTGALTLTVAVPLIAAPAIAAPTPIDPWATLTDTGSSANAAVADALGHVFVLDLGAHQVVQFEPDRSEVGTYPLPTGSSPRGIGADLSGNVFILDSASKDVARIPVGGVLEPTWSSLPSATRAFDVQPDGRILALTTTNDVYEIATDGSTRLVFKPAYTANDVDADPAGDIYVSTVNGRVLVRTAAGTTVETVVAEGENLTDISVVSGGAWVVLEPKSDTLHGHERDGGTFARPLGGDVDHFTTDGVGSSYYMVAGSTELRTIPLAGGSPTVVATLSTSGSVVDMTTTPAQTILVSWGSRPSVSAISLVPAITSSPLNVTTTVGTPFEASISSSGGIDPVTITSPNLPAWLHLSDSGKLTGTPTSPGTYAFDVVATNALTPSLIPPATPQQQTIVVNPAVVPTPTPTPSGGGGASGGSTTGGGAVNGAISAGTSNGIPAATSDKRGALASTGYGAAPWCFAAALIVVIGAGITFARTRSRSSGA